MTCPFCQSHAVGGQDEVDALSAELDNWRTNLGTPGFRARYLAALARHLLAASSGQWTDTESGLPHIAHAAVNLMFLQCDLLAQPRGGNEP